jgi:protein tyrosine/serine phosphatase
MRDLNGIAMMITRNKFLPPVGTSISGRFQLLFLMLAVASLAAASFANSDRKSEDKSKSASTETCGVENFGKVTDFYFRGAQPKEDEYSELAALGVKTIIDLRHDPKEFAQEMAQRAGLKYINFPMSDTRYPSSEAAPKFLSLINDKENWPVYVHCAGGRHRTGAMTAVFRMTVQGWDVDRAYDEMKDYDFYTRWGHKAMKRFVFDYYHELLQRRDNQPADSSSK